MQLQKEKDPNLPNYECAAYEAQKDVREMVRDVLGGTPKVRAKGQKYLPKLALEPTLAYQKRLALASLWPATKRTADGFTGMLFKQKPVLGADAPVEIKGADAKDGWQDNIDLCGNHLDVVARALAFDTIADGDALLLVDSPSMAGDNPAQEKELNLRPYVVRYCKEQAKNWRWEFRNGRRVLAMLVLEEKSNEPDGLFGEKEVERYRVLRDQIVIDEASGGTMQRVSAQIWTEVKDDKGDVSYIPGPVMPVPLDEIPVAIASAGNQLPLENAPLLEGIAEQNLLHYRLSSLLEKAINLCVPLTAVKGKIVPLNEGKETKDVSPDELIGLETPDGDMINVEPQGVAAKLYAEKIERCEQSIAHLGLQALAPVTQTRQTAAEVDSDTLGEESQLAVTSRSIEDAVQRALGFMMEFRGKKVGVSWNLKPPARKLTLTPDEIRIKSDMVERNQYRLEDLLQEMSETGHTPETFDVAKIAAELVAAREAASAAADRAFNAGGFGGL